jgi:peptidoglycan/LPS O-acetylase OafA/YrhL
MTAVISFFLLSGYVMTALIQKHYPDISDTPGFYVDRIARLGPQFYFYSLATLAAVSLLGLHHELMRSVPGELSILAQLSIVPLIFYGRFDSMLLPQAWSLGPEVCFYAIFPFVLLHKARTPVALVSLAVFALACTEVIDTDLFAYRFLPGTFFIFICGSWLYQADRTWQAYAPYAVAFAAAAVLALTYIAPLPVNARPAHSVLLGIALGIPAVALLKDRFASHASNALAGDLSYGVFLSHYLIIGAIVTFSPWPVDFNNTAAKLSALAVVCAMSLLASYLTFHALEAPLIAWRRRFRGRKQTADVRAQVLPLSLPASAMER